MRERFPSLCDTHEEAREYYRNRATQMLTYGMILEGLKDLEWGVEASITYDDKNYRSVFVLNDHQGKGHLTRWFEEFDGEFITSDACPTMRSWLDSREIPYRNIITLGMHDACYTAAVNFYGNRRAARSDQFYMNHIDEGLFILREISASGRARSAFCLHPLVQMDGDLQQTWKNGTFPRHGAPAMLLAMEYRWVANNHLAKVHEPKIPQLSPLEDVNDMLIADKIQNRKDFELYLRGREDVANSDRLDEYFQEWFVSLGISEEFYQHICAEIDRRTGRLL